MTGLHELFEEAVDSPSPPSRLTAEEVYAAGRRRRRRRLATATCASAAALATIAAAAASLLAPGKPVERPPVAGRTIPAVGSDPHVGQLVQWAGAADANHLYRAFSTCTGPPPCSKARFQLTGSDDGGHTWSERGTPREILNLAVLDAGALVGVVPPQGQAHGVTTTVMTSTDGARTWTAVQPAAAVHGVPDGSTAICWPQARDGSCALQVVNPGLHQIGALAEQPPLKAYPPDELVIRKSGGRLWVGGIDPATGRPAAATSADSGRTWSVHVFADAPPCSSEGCRPPSLASGGGATVYAVTEGGSKQAIYRGTAGAGPGGTSWQRLTMAERIPQRRGLGSFVAGDGTHVLYQLVDDPDQNTDVYRFWAARADGGYESVELTGLPASAGPIRRTPNGWFYALSHADGGLYGSTDGWHWSPVTGN
ncbi:sialidase family protein [Micromonospora sp. NPDC007271]|uniref:sialidase family protein n=1 Tax=Micromonospora sp. NPDC007271 TaxID=3154587 RepID=UPI0033C49F10